MVAIGCEANARDFFWRKGRLGGSSSRGVVDQTIFGKEFLCPGGLGPRAGEQHQADFDLCLAPSARGRTVKLSVFRDRKSGLLMVFRTRFPY